MEFLLPLAAVAGAFTLTYFCCMRPMRRGHGCGMKRTTGSAPAASGRSERLDEQIHAAREELRKLKQGAT
ncbi:hypothetical protein HDA32_004623 [Spinactinospora alkalitolerans]|uniref:Uncharacterized protein n=1 Tax=Spinactinospora alkalitolerans TaxID=687207 RepID=A0A852U3K7_9ACTN|nr:hypothetical protein [Spinactinospora alkalitolerans]NYE49503.1 hypothetical protein [Spinactinospora alkalitolerans]